MGVEEVGDGAMSFVRWKPTVKDRVQGPSHQLSPKLSSISSRPPLCCFHLWLSVSAYNDTLSSACGDNVISSTSRAKAFFQVTILVKCINSNVVNSGTELDLASFCSDRVTFLNYN